MVFYEWNRDGLRISTDPAEVDLDVVHGFLTTSYWAWGVTRERVARSIEGSIPFSLFEDGRQVGFARVISDWATFAWLADVFVVPEARGRGLGVWLVETILSHPELQGLRRWSLSTRDAHSLYARFGFVRSATPERMMDFRPGSVEAGGAPPAAQHAAGGSPPASTGGTAVPQATGDGSDGQSRPTGVDGGRRR